MILEVKDFSDNKKMLQDKDVERFWQIGAGIFRNFFDEDNYFINIENALNDRLDLLEMSFNREDGFRKTTSLSDRIISLERKDLSLQSALYEAMAQAPAMYQAASNEKLIKLVQILLSKSIMLHLRSLLLMLSPQQQWHLAGWHQDWYYNKGPQTTLTAYIPLQKTNLENGGLRIALPERGTEWELLEHGDFNASTKWHTINPRVVKTFKQISEVELERGDLLLFHSLMPHTATNNASSSVRFVANFRYFDLENQEFLKNRWKIEDRSLATTALARKL